MGVKVPNLDSVIIAGNEFRGIGYQGLLTVNSKTYVESPQRTNDGSIPNINDHDSFVVPRCKINFKYFKIEDYRRLCRILNSANEFEVTYYDKEHGEDGKFVTHMMYAEPEEMKKIFNVGTYVFGVLDYEVSFIGTLNARKTFDIIYHTNLPSGSSTLPVTGIKWGDSEKIFTVSDLVSKEVAVPDGSQISYWQQGTADSPNANGWKVYPNANVSVFEEMHLWANWETV